MGFLRIVAGGKMTLPSVQEVADGIRLRDDERRFVVVFLPSREEHDVPSSAPLRRDDLPFVYRVVWLVDSLRE